MAKKESNPTKSLKIPQFIILSAKLCAFISTKLVTSYAAKLFTTPIKHKIPKREFEMEHASIQQQLHVPSINRSVVTYEYGKIKRKILLVHGWSGRGTQLLKLLTNS